MPLRGCCERERRFAELELMYSAFLGGFAGSSVRAPGSSMRAPGSPIVAPAQYLMSSHASHDISCHPALTRFTLGDHGAIY